MDFRDTPQEAEFRAEARAWLDATAKPLEPGQRKRVNAASPELVAEAQTWQAQKADAGWACITWPVEFGGRDASRIQSVIWNQEEARYDTPPNIFTIGQGMLGPTLMAHGTPEQKERYLNKMLRGEEIWSQLFSEPNAGSDLAGLAMVAVRDGDDWILNGQKIWTSGAHYSHLGMILTRTDPEATKHAGITYFIMDMKAPGIEIRPIRQINRAENFNEVFLSDVRIPDCNRVGGVNDGWRGAITTLMNERSTLGGGGPGLGFHDLMRLAGSTPGIQGSALDDAAIRQRLANYYVRLKGLEYTSSRTLTAISRGTTPGPQSSMGKLVAARMRQEMAAFALELQGAGGAVMDPGWNAEGGAWQQMYLASPGGRLAGGTDEILRNIIAERILGCPPEARADKGMRFRDVPTGHNG